METFVYTAIDTLGYELKIRLLVSRGYTLTERGLLKPKSFALRNTGQNNIIYVQKAFDCPGQLTLNFAY